MKLPQDAIIAAEKLTLYLLQWQPENDKSGFLARAGYELANWQQLAMDLRQQLLPLDAQLQETTRWGELHEIRGRLTGPNGVALRVVTTWMKEPQTTLTKFITLFPDKRA